jgi:hypothetical protein
VEQLSNCIVWPVGSRNAALSTTLHNWWIVASDRKLAINGLHGDLLEADFWPVDGFNIQVKTFFLKTDYSTFARDSGTTPTGAAADGTGVRSFVFPTAL